MKYSNGDVYEGGWRANKRFGKGRCTYANGNYYEVCTSGEWESSTERTLPSSSSRLHGLRHPFRVVLSGTKEHKRHLFDRPAPSRSPCRANGQAKPARSLLAHLATAATDTGQRPVVVHRSMGTTESL